MFAIENLTISFGRAVFFFFRPGHSQFDGKFAILDRQKGYTLLSRGLVGQMIFPAWF